VALLSSDVSNATLLTLEHAPLKPERAPLGR
jgi:hypothetical protein